MQTFYASTLLETYGATGTLADAVEPTAGVYFWKLRLAPSCSPDDRTNLMKHIERISNLPYGRIHDVALTRGLRLEGLRLGSDGLPRDKLEGLKKLCGTKQGAKFLVDFLEQLETKTPALYCGQSGDVSRRLLEHLTGGSIFGELIERDPELDWDDLLVEVLPTGKSQAQDVVIDETRELRQSLEHFATLLTVSMFTDRAG